MEKILTHIYYSDNKKADVKNWKISDKEKELVLKFIQEYETGKITRRTATNPKALIERILSYLKFSLTHINKDKPSKQDLEMFFDNLFKDKYKGHNQKTGKYNGEPYSIKTKKEILEMLIRYYSWKFPKDLDLISPLKIEIKNKKRDPPSLELTDIDKLYKECKTAEDKYFIAVLFASGARAEEFHNIRFSDVEMPKGKDMFVKVRIRSEYSKTEGRTIFLYYKHSLEAVKRYLSKRIEEGIKPEDPIFTRKYNRQKDWLNALGQRVISRNLNYHLFRHTCASWLASRLNRQQMCIFFGWKFSSPMPDVYIKRDAVEMRDVTSKFEATELEDMRLKFEEYKRFTEEKFDKMQEEFAEHINEFIKKMETKKNKLPTIKPTN